MNQSQQKRIYLDNAATTQPYKEVIDVITEWENTQYGNPMSVHADGRTARNQIDIAREIITETLECEFSELVFTASGSEAATLAIVGSALHHFENKRKRILFGSTEHECVLSTKNILTKLGYQIDLIPCLSNASININALEDMMSDDVLLVSTMHANNETGSINDVSKINAIVSSYGALHHVDAVQTYLTPIFSDYIWKVADINPDLMNISSHKIHGLKGAGALYIKRGVKLSSVISGGGQERNLRGGTEHTSSIIGFGKATEIGHLHMNENRKKKMDLRNYFLDLLRKISNIEMIESCSNYKNVLPGHAHVRFKNIDAESLLILLDRAGVSCSTGSACSGGSINASHVLLSSGFTPEEAKSSIRFTFSHLNTIKEVEDTIEILSKIFNEYIR